MNIDVDELMRGIRDVQKEASMQPLPTGMPKPMTPQAPAAPQQPGIFGKVENWIGDHTGYNAAKGMYQEGKDMLGQGKQMMGQLGQMAPMMLPLMMSGMGGAGNTGASSLQPGQPVARVPTAPAGWKYGSDKTAMLIPTLAAVGGSAFKDTVNSLTSPNPHKETPPSILSSKDPAVEKALANPAVNAYIHNIVDKKS